MSSLAIEIALRCAGSLHNLTQQDPHPRIINEILKEQESDIYQKIHNAFS